MMSRQLRVGDSHSGHHMPRRGGDTVAGITAGNVCDEAREVRGEREEGADKVSDTALEDVAVQRG